jgi:hypothetical protein
MRRTTLQEALKQATVRSSCPKLFAVLYDFTRAVAEDIVGHNSPSDAPQRRQNLPALPSIRHHRARINSVKIEDCEFFS